MTDSKRLRALWQEDWESTYRRRIGRAVLVAIGTALLLQTPAIGYWHEMGHVYQVRLNGREPSYVSWTETGLPSGGTADAEIMAGGFYYEFALWSVLAVIGAIAARRQLTRLEPARLIALALAFGGGLGSLAYMLRSSDFARLRALNASLWPMFDVYVYCFLAATALSIRILLPLTWRQQCERIDGIAEWRRGEQHSEPGQGSEA
jgi:hypothetical protein